MALTTVILHREGILALVVAGATGFAIFHISHGGFNLASLIWEDLCMAVNTLVCLQVKLVAECSQTARVFKSNITWL